MEGYIACVTYFAGNFAPRNWAYCQGQILSIATNTALFSLLGTTYGGNGQTTFALPNVASRAIIGAGMGQGPGLSVYNIGEVTGSPTATMTILNMPNHTHAIGPSTSTMQVNGATQDADGPAGTYFGNSATENAYGTMAGAGNATFGPLQVTGTVTPSGNGSPFTIQQPYLGMNPIICLYGIFPSRN